MAAFAATQLVDAAAAQITYFSSRKIAAELTRNAIGCAVLSAPIAAYDLVVVKMLVAYRLHIIAIARQDKMAGCGCATNHSTADVDAQLFVLADEELISTLLTEAILDVQLHVSIRDVLWIVEHVLAATIRAIVIAADVVVSHGYSPYYLYWTTLAFD